MPTPVEYALHCEPVVGWLIRGEPEVFAALQRFLSDEGPPVISVAGPPTIADKALAAKQGKAPPLPTVVLYLRKFRDLTSGARCCEVACTDRDMIEVGRWHMLAQAKHRQGGALQ